MPTPHDTRDTPARPATAGPREAAISSPAPAPDDSGTDPTDPRVAFLLAYAQALHRLGVPAHRLESALDELALRLRVEAQFLSTPTSIQAAFGPLGRQRLAMVRVSPGSSDLGRLAELDAIGHQVFHDVIDPAEGTRATEALLAAPPRYGKAATLAAFALGSAAAARFFSTQLVDLAFGGLAGLAVGLIAVMVGRDRERANLVVPLAAFAAAMVAVMGGAQGASPTAVIVSGTLVLLPGLSMTTAMTELGTGNLVSGTARAAGAIVVLLELAFGVVLAQQLAAWVPQLPSLGLPKAPLQPWTSWLALVPVILSFHVLFQARWRDLRWLAMGCLLSFSSMTLLKGALTVEGLPFVGALLLTMFSNAFARAARQPASIPLVPGILLLVPGSIGLRGMTTMLQDAMLGVDQLFRMAFVAVALAAGVLVANVLVRPRRAL